MEKEIYSIEDLCYGDYVIYDKGNDSYVRWESSGDIIIFGDKEEAEMDCRGNETLVSCAELPLHIKEEIVNQLNRDLK